LLVLRDKVYGVKPGMTCSALEKSDIPPESVIATRKVMILRRDPADGDVVKRVAVISGGAPG
jgi:hypothetical protein